MADAQEISQIANLVMSMMSEDESAPSTSRGSSFSTGKYIAERLLDYKICEDGKKMYLVKWFGYPPEESTWECECNLSCHYMMQKIVEEKQQLFNNVGPAYIFNSHLHRSNFVTGTLGGFDSGRSPELILGATEKDGDILFLVNWKRVSEVDMTPRTIANVRCPQLVTQFHEERMRWRSSQEAAEEEEEEINVMDIEVKEDFGDMDENTREEE